MEGDAFITAFATEEPIDSVGLYSGFLARETEGTGTIVLHQGRVKRPGKRVADFTSVELKALTPKVGGKLAELAKRAKTDFRLNQVLIVHRLGMVDAGESVLVVIVSSATRGPGFSACSWIVDEVKKESFISLIERP